MRSWTVPIERGKTADLVLLNANPLESIANTKQISAVIREGHFNTRADPDAILEKVGAEAPNR